MEHTKKFGKNEKKIFFKWNRKIKRKKLKMCHFGEENITEKNIINKINTKKKYEKKENLRKFKKNLQKV